MVDGSMSGLCTLYLILIVWVRVLVCIVKTGSLISN